MKKLFALALLPLFIGCMGYHRGSTVPADMRTIYIPAFENQTQYPMVGAIATQQTIDAVVEDGTFHVTSAKAARIRLIVEMQSIDTRSVRYDRNRAIVPEEYHATLNARVYAFDAKNRTTLINGKIIQGTTSFLTRNDYQSGIKDALPRLAHELAQNILIELQAISAPVEKPTAVSADTPAL